jgi:ferrous iron transport protein B
VAVRRRGLDEVREALGDRARRPREIPAESRPVAARFRQRPAPRRDRRRRDVGETAAAAHPPIDRSRCTRWPGRSSSLTLMFVMFQAVFAWSEAPVGWIEAAGMAGGPVTGAAARRLPALAAGRRGVLAGVGAVVVFLPQILILFLFILLLEATGYMVRAAFLMDRLMARVGLSGRAFIPLLSSFACAVPASWRRARSTIPRTG